MLDFAPYSILATRSQHRQAVFILLITCDPPLTLPINMWHKFRVTCNVPLPGPKSCY
jgi:hypothetical protein